VSDACLPFGHPALFYRGDTEYLDGLIPFLDEGLNRGEPVAVAVPHRNLLLIEKALEDRAPAVRFIDMERAGRNPGAILPGILCAFAAENPGPVRIVGEPIWHYRSDVEYPACAQHEALINLAFAGRPSLTILCPYDTSRLDRGVLADAERTHPELWDGAGVRSSPAFDPDGVVASYNLPLEPPEDHVSFTFDYARLTAARTFAERWARRQGLSKPQREDLVLVVGELSANSVQHGGGVGVLRLWREHGEAVCDVTDAGTLADPLAGRIPAPVYQLGGRGLVLVNRIADLVRSYRLPGRTTTRAYFRG